MIIIIGSVDKTHALPNSMEIENDFKIDQKTQFPKVFGVGEEDLSKSLHNYWNAENKQRMEQNGTGLCFALHELASCHLSSPIYVFSLFWLNWKDKDRTIPAYEI